MEDFNEDLSNSFIDEDENDLINQSNKVDGINPPHQEHRDVLHKAFGHKEFRPMQWKIINSVLNERRDNCAVMATGYGKSLCYQYPSVYCGGVTIVVSPLISLMEDQVLSLTVSNISACLLGTAQTQQRKVIEEILNNKYSLVYATPEFCCGDMGKSLLVEMDTKLTITLIAIDEAHCVSTWGHDFRHQYRELACLRSLLPHVPILAVTATATQRVRNDIISSLKLRNPQILCSGFDRPNLWFSVQLKGNMGIISDLRKAMIRQDGDWIFTGSTIVYCITRKQTEQVADLLKSQGIKCLPYHAGLSVKQRKETHEKFVRDKITVIVATIAFGMGIDKPDVRNIVHYGASRDIESYYQEVGRAGRDGQPAKCISFYNSSDFETLRSLREMGYGSEKMKHQKEAMAQLFKKYLETSGCRRQFILQHFEGAKVQTSHQPSISCCDNCSKKLLNKQEEYEEVDANGLIDITEYAHTLLASIKAMGRNCGLTTYILFIRGSKSSKISDKHQKLALHGSGKHKTEQWWKCIAGILEREKYLEKSTFTKGTFSFCTIHASKKGEKFLDDVVKQPKRTSILVEPTPDMRILLKKKKPKEPDPLPVHHSSTSTNASDWIFTKKTLQHNNHTTTSSEDEVQKEERMRIYRQLLTKRTEMAYALDCMPYMIASNESLMKMSQLKPTSLDDLQQCNLEGFTEAKINKFGEEFVKVITSLCPNKGSKEAKSIKYILENNPMSGAKLSPSAEITYNLFKNGVSVENVAKERNMATSTIFSHLLQCMKLGFPIKLKDLNISTKVKNTVMYAIKNSPCPLDAKPLTTIKELCPADITFNEIKAVMAYLEIRDHIKALNCDYEEFDEESDSKEFAQTTTKDAHPEYVDRNTSDSSDATIADENGVDDAALNALVDEIELGGYLNETIDLTDDQEKNVKHVMHKTTADVAPAPPLKKQKFNLSLLDSPPRKFT